MVPTKELWTEDNTNKESTGEQENCRAEGSPIAGVSTMAETETML